MDRTKYIFETKIYYVNKQTRFILGKYIRIVLIQYWKDVDLFTSFKACKSTLKINSNISINYNSIL